MTHDIREWNENIHPRIYLSQHLSVVYSNTLSNLNKNEFSYRIQLLMLSFLFSIDLPVTFDFRFTRCFLDVLIELRDRGNKL